MSVLLISHIYNKKLKADATSHGRLDYIVVAFILTRCNPMLVDISVSHLITETVSDRKTTKTIMHLCNDSVYKLRALMANVKYEF